MCDSNSNFYFACWPFTKDTYEFIPAEYTLPHGLTQAPTMLRSVVVRKTSLSALDFFNCICKYGPVLLARYDVNLAGVTFPSKEQATACFEELVVNGHYAVYHAVSVSPLSFAGHIPLLIQKQGIISWPGHVHPSEPHTYSTQMEVWTGWSTDHITDAMIDLGRQIQSNIPPDKS